MESGGAGVEPNGVLAANVFGKTVLEFMCPGTRGKPTGPQGFQDLALLLLSKPGTVKVKK